jgi:hypothetical protein
MQYQINKHHSSTDSLLCIWSNWSICVVLQIILLVLQNIYSNWNLTAYPNITVVCNQCHRPFTKPSNLQHAKHYVIQFKTKPQVTLERQWPLSATGHAWQTKKKKKNLENPSLAPSTYPKRYCVMTAHNMETAITRQLHHDTGHALLLCVDVKHTFSCHGIPANILTFDCHTP